MDDTEIERLANVSNYDDTEIRNELDAKANNADIPTKTSELENDSGFITKLPDVPNKVSELENDSGFVNEEYVNNKIEESENNREDKFAKIEDVPTKTSELENDSGFLEHKGVFNTWDELCVYEFKDGELFLFNLSGAFSSYMGAFVGQYSGFKIGSNYVYRYINCFNVVNQQSLTLDMIKQNVTIRQMNIQDTNDYFTSNGLDDILQEIGGQLNGIEELLGGI